MIKSMTAYAKAEVTEKQLNVIVEMRTLNSRFLDCQIRVPHGYSMIEDKIKECVSRTQSRGRFEIRLFVNDSSETTVVYEVNEPKALAYRQALETLARCTGVSPDITLGLMAGPQGMITPGESPIDYESHWTVIERCLSMALEDLDRMRRAEGDFLRKDLLERLDMIESAIVRIETDVTDLVPIYQKRLLDRIKALTEGIVELDQARIAQEAAILADRSDISEEIVRARSHVAQFRSIVDGKEAAGRTLNFLLQEFNREFNTMGSKVGQSSVAHIIVNVKSELERLREQVQNIE